MKKASNPVSGVPARQNHRVRRLGLHTQHQPVVIMRSDCDVCRCEGLSSRSQVLVSNNGRAVQATLFQVTGDGLLTLDEVGVSETAWQLLGLSEGDEVRVSHPPTVESLASVRRRIYGNRLDGRAFDEIVRDVVAGRYTDVHLAAFLTASAALPLDTDETAHLTGAMINVGERMRWDAPVVVDKHCVGGLPGNRTTPIVVAIVSANGLVMPKTSSRAITSPAGTADTMETLAPVDLDLATLRRVVELEGGCIAWGGAVHLSPADDIFVRVERELDVDTEGQLIASVLSKKIAAGSTHVVLDTPAGLYGRDLKEVLKRADKLLIPLQPSVFDIMATQDFVAELQERRRSVGLPIGVVGMRVDARTLSAEKLRAFVQGLELPVLTYLRDTQNYINLAGQGLTLFDVAPGRVQRDLEQWLPICRWLEQ